MAKMRIPIREQLGFLVLLASTIGLAVIAVATWVRTYFITWQPFLLFADMASSPTMISCSTYGMLSSDLGGL